MPIMINLMKKLDPPEENQEKNIPVNPDKLLTCEHFNFLHPNFSEEIEVHKEKNIEVLKSRVSYWLGHYWVEFDDMIIKPWLNMKKKKRKKLTLLEAKLKKLKIL